MGLLVMGLISVGVSITIVAVVMDKVQSHLQNQINQLRKDKHELTMRVIKLEGKTNEHDIELNGVKFTADMNDISLNHVNKLLDKMAAMDVRKEGVK